MDRQLIADVALAMIDLYAGRLPALGRVLVRLDEGAYWLRTGGTVAGTARLGNETVLPGVTVQQATAGFPTVLVLVLPELPGLTEAAFYAPPGVATPGAHFDCLLARPDKPGVRGFRRTDGGWVVVGVAPHAAPDCVNRTVRLFVRGRVGIEAACDPGRLAVTCAGRQMASGRALGGLCTDLAVGAAIVRRDAVPEAPEGVEFSGETAGLSSQQQMALRMWGFVPVATAERRSDTEPARQPEALEPPTKRRRGDEVADTRLRWILAVADRDATAIITATPMAVRTAARVLIAGLMELLQQAYRSGCMVMLDARALAVGYVPATADMPAMGELFGDAEAIAAMFRAVWCPEVPGRYPTEPLSRLLARGRATGCFARADWRGCVAAHGPAPLLLACLGTTRVATGAPLPWLYHGFWDGLGRPAFAAIRGSKDLAQAARALGRLAATAIQDGSDLPCCEWETLPSTAALSPYRKLAASLGPGLVFNERNLTASVRSSAVVLGAAFPSALAEHTLVQQKMTDLGVLATDGFVMDHRTTDRGSYVVVRTGKRLVPVRPLAEMLGEFEVPWIGDALERDLVLVVGADDLDCKGFEYYSHARFSTVGLRRVWRWLTRGGVLHRCIARRLAQVPVGAPARCLSAFGWRDAGCVLNVDTPLGYTDSAEAYFLFAPVAVHGPSGPALCTTVNAALAEWATGTERPDRLLRLGSGAPPGSRGVLSDEAKAVMFASLSGCVGGDRARTAPTVVLLRAKGADRHVVGRSAIGTLVSHLIGALPADYSEGRGSLEVVAYSGDGPAVVDQLDKPEGKGAHVMRVATERAHGRDQRGLLHADGPVPFCVWALLVACRGRYVTSVGMAAELADIREKWVGVLGKHETNTLSIP